MDSIQTLTKWGNGNGIRLPQRVIKAAHLHPNQQLAISVEKGVIILTPVKDVGHKLLEGILKGVTPELIKGEIDWGIDIGAEQYE